MTTTPEQINLWRQSPTEHQRLEFKKAKNQFDNRKLYEYCVALTNEGGGRLLLGITDKPPRYVMGEKMSNQSLRERFGVSESKAATVSLVIRAVKEAVMIKALRRTRRNRHQPVMRGISHSGHENALKLAVE